MDDIVDILNGVLAGSGYQEVRAQTILRRARDEIVALRKENGALRGGIEAAVRAEALEEAAQEAAAAIRALKDEP